MFGNLSLRMAIRVALLVCFAAALAILSPLLIGADKLGAPSEGGVPAASAAGACSSQTEGQVCAEYFNGTYTSGPAAPVLVRLENLPTRANDWGAGSPGVGVNADHFWARYTANITVSPEVFATTTYQFIAVVDDGVRVYVDGKPIIDGWKDQAATTYRGVVTLGEGVHPVTIEYYENAGNAVAQFGWWEDCRGCFLAEYYNNRTLSGFPALVRGEDAISYDWGTGSPGTGVNVDNFSVRWTGRQLPPFPFETAGTYFFTATTDDGMRMFLDGEKLFSSWEDQAPATYRFVHDVAAGSHTVVVEYYEHGGGAVARFGWTRVCPDGQAYAEIFDTQTPVGSPTLVGCEALPFSHDWGTGSPGTEIGADHFSARWTAAVHAETGVFGPGAYTLVATVDDGVRIWVDDKLVLDKWFDQAPTTYRVDVPMDQGDHLIKMEYYENAGGAVAKLRGYSICPSTFRAEYFPNATLSGTPTDVVCDPNGYDGTIDYNWGNGGPAELAPRVDDFSAIWTGAYMFQAASYTFTATTDDGVRVYLDNKLVLDQWRDQAPATISKTIWVPAGYHTVRMEYYEHLGGAVAKLSWARTYRSEVIVDDTSSGFTKGGSYWQQSTIGYNGHAWWTYVNGSSVDSWGEWRANLAGGKYEVFVWVPRANSSTARAPYTIFYVGGQVTKVVSQASYYDQWVSLGTYTFYDGQSLRVRLTDATGESTNSRTIAFDAVRFVPR